jgi:hypothetical protein
LNPEKTPVLGVRRIGTFGSKREPALLLGRGGGAFVPGERAEARCLPYLSERMLGVVYPYLSRRVLGIALREEHASPAEECECGIYAFNAITPRFEDAYFGVFLGWGRVFHGKSYWRAQYAKPLAVGKLGNPERFDRKGERAAWVRRLAERYGIPLLGEGDIEYYAEQFGRWPAIGVGAH